jgi:lipid-binding SYLF domain-containing protein
MKTLDKLAGILLVLALSAAPAWADEYTETIDIFKNAVESSGFFGHAFGYAVYPTIGKGGVGLGAAHGIGRVYRQGKYVGNTKMTQLSIGFQLGAQAFRQIIFFENEQAFKKFTSGNFEFGAQASAVAITAGAQAAATSTGSSAGAGISDRKSTTVGGYHDGMAVFTVAKGGLMYEASISGQKFSYTPK